MTHRGKERGAVFGTTLLQNIVRSEERVDLIERSIDIEVDVVDPRPQSIGKTELGEKPVGRRDLVARYRVAEHCHG